MTRSRSHFEIIDVSLFIEINLEVVVQTYYYQPKSIDTNFCRLL